MKLSHLSVAVFSAIALAACGGSSDNAVDNSHNGGKKEETKKEEVKPTVPAIVADQLKTKPSTLWENGVANQDSTLEINGKETKVVDINLAALADGKEKYGYVQNSKLLKDGKTSAAGKIYAKQADGTFAKVVAGKGPAMGMVFASGTKDEDLKDPKKALKAADVFQKPEGANQGSYLTQITAFGNTYAISNAKSFPEEITFDNLEAGKVVDGKVVYTAHTQVAQLDDAGAEIKDPDNKPTYLNVAQDIPVAGYKAYKQAYSTVVLHTDAEQKALVNGKLVDGVVNAGALSIVGAQSLGLPDTGSAVYKGKAFTTKSTADLKLDVQFGAEKFLIAADITNRTSNKDGKALSALKSKPKAIDNNRDITLNLEAVDETATAEYDYLSGKFYGTKAEEAAGALYNGGNVVGGFAASSK